jgi:hypothetical protein
MRRNKDPRRIFMFIESGKTQARRFLWSPPTLSGHPTVSAGPENWRLIRRSINGETEFRGQRRSKTEFWDEDTREKPRTHPILRIEKELRLVGRSRSFFIDRKCCYQLIQMFYNDFIAVEFDNKSIVEIAKARYDKSANGFPLKHCGNDTFINTCYVRESGYFRTSTDCVISAV